MSSNSKEQSSVGLVEEESATDSPDELNSEAIREENEQWERTWDVLMSMISKVVPCSRRQTSTGDERRSELIAAVGKLIQASYSAGEVNQLRRECAHLKKKVNRNREKLEEHLNEVREANEQRLIDTLAGVHRQVQVHIESQRRTLRKWDRDGRKRSIEQRMTLDSARPVRKKLVTVHESNGEDVLRRLVGSDAEEDSDLETFTVEKRDREDLAVDSDGDSEETSEGSEPRGREAKRKKLATSSSDDECVANEGYRYGSSSSEEELCRKSAVSKKPKRVSSSSEEDSEAKGAVSKKPKRVSSSSEEELCRKGAVSKKSKRVSSSSEEELCRKGAVSKKPKRVLYSSEEEMCRKGGVSEKPKYASSSFEEDSESRDAVSMKRKYAGARSQTENGAKRTMSPKPKLTAARSQADNGAKRTVLPKPKRATPISEGLAGEQGAALSVNNVVANVETESDSKGVVSNKNKVDMRRSDKDSDAKCTATKKLKFVAPSSEDEHDEKGLVMRQREHDDYRAKDDRWERRDSPAEVATMSRPHRHKPCIPKETVNRLIAATNQMRSDYRALTQIFSDAEPLDPASDVSELTD